MKTRSVGLRLISALALAAGLALASCSGGGGGGSGGTPPPPPPPPPPAGGTTYTPGVFQAASVYKNRCQTVRTGVDIEGNGFPDTQGSTTLENFWLRSWTRETYLWNTEVTDRDPNAYNDRLVYFGLMRTMATTPSGADKDQFHFSEPTEDYLASRLSTPSASYGMRLVAFSTVPPRDFRVAYTEPNAPASAVVGGVPNLVRGTKILEVDGVNLVSSNNVDALNNGLFPANAGETHTFLVQDPGSSSTRTITMVSANLSTRPVNRTRVIDTPTGSVGYILFNTFSPFSSEQQIAAAISEMEAAGVTDLVLDLRHNGGGLLAVASQLSYMVAGPSRTAGSIFERLRFNAAAGNTNPVTGQTNNAVPFYSTGVGFSLNDGTPLDTLNLSRVYVLSSGSTCSASESVINSLRGIDVEVVLIGNTTCGKPYGFYPTDNCGETYYTIQFQGVNDKGFGDYPNGFTPANSTAQFAVDLPGCQISDTYRYELGDPQEALLSAALTYRSTGSCPAIVASGEETGLVAQGDTVRKVDDNPLAVTLPARGIMETNRDMTLPEEAGR